MTELSLERCYVQVPKTRQRPCKRLNWRQFAERLDSAKAPFYFLLVMKFSSHTRRWWRAWHFPSRERGASIR